MTVLFLSINVITSEIIHGLLIHKKNDIRPGPGGQIWKFSHFLLKKIRQNI
jgi:hypothetical protein